MKPYVHDVLKVFPILESNCLCPQFTTIQNREKKLRRPNNMFRTKERVIMSTRGSKNLVHRVSSNKYLPTTPKKPNDIKSYKLRSCV